MKFKKQKAYTEEWELYEKGKEYNRSIGLYDEVDTNERFYRGDQWTGVAASGLPTPVFNFFKRIIDHYISNIASAAVKMRFRYASPLPRLTAEEEKSINEALQNVAENRWEKLKMDKLISDSLYDAAVTGDAFAYTYWDPNIKTGQAYTGDFKTVLIDNTNVFFGNPNVTSVQTQPYILISGRELVSDLRKQAEKAGVTKENIARIVPDSDTEKEFEKLALEMAENKIKYGDVTVGGDALGTENGENGGDGGDGGDGIAFTPDMSAYQLATAIVKRYGSGGKISKAEHNLNVKKYLEKLTERYNITDEYMDKVIFILDALGYTGMNDTGAKTASIVNEAELQYDKAYSRAKSLAKLLFYDYDDRNEYAKKRAYMEKLDYVYTRCETMEQFYDACLMLGLNNEKAEEYLDTVVARKDVKLGQNIS